MSKLKKSFASAGQLAYLLMNLQDVQAGVDFEALSEQRDPATSKKLKSAMRDLASVLADLVDEEIAELSDAEKLSRGELRKRAELSARALALPVVEKIAEITEGLRAVEEGHRDIRGSIDVLKRAGGFAPSRGTPVHKHQDSGNTGPEPDDLLEKFARLSPEQQLDLAMKAAQARPITGGAS